LLETAITLFCGPTIGQGDRLKVFLIIDHKLKNMLESRFRDD